MKVSLKINISGILIDIEEDDFAEDIFTFLNNVIQFSNSNRDKIIPQSQSMDVESIPSTIEKDQKAYVEASYNEKLIMIAKDSKISPDILVSIYDFGSDSVIPPLLYNFNLPNKVENQRMALILLLYANYVLNGEATMTSEALTPLLTKSNIDPSNLFNVKQSPEFRKWVSSDGRKYRITDPGKIRAKQILKEIENSI